MQRPTGVQALFGKKAGASMRRRGPGPQRTGSGGIVLDSVVSSTACQRGVEQREAAGC